MNRPADPRKHGLQEPKKIIRETKRVYIEKEELEEKYITPKVNLKTINNLWDNTLKALALSSPPKTLVEGPFVSTPVIGNSYIEYSIEYENLCFDLEKEIYNNRVKKFEDDLKAFEKEIERRHCVRNSNESIDEKIERTKQRLANLMAMKEGKELPFP